MFNIKANKPQILKALTFLVGAAALYISRRYPVAAPLANDVLTLLGVAGIAAGRPQIVQKPPA